MWSNPSQSVGLDIEDVVLEAAGGQRGHSQPPLKGLGVAHRSTSAGDYGMAMVCGGSINTRPRFPVGGNFLTTDIAPVCERRLPRREKNPS